MTFNWKKKSRSNRFSRLVADHIQSPKHGGSLVVETGFPTSLIDLYVRNRSRFRKTSKRSEKSESNSSCELSEVVDEKIEEVVDENVVVSDFSDLDDGIVANIKPSEKNSLEDFSVSVLSSDGSLDGEGVGECDDVEIVKCGGEITKLSSVYVVLLKVLLIVVLVLGCKRFKVGITVSAFVLFVLEMVGKPTVRRPSLSRALSVQESRETENVESLKRNVIRNGVVVVSGEKSEIEEQLELKREVRLKDVLDEVRSEGLMEGRRKSSRRDVMKLKMKKLVPKKLRKSSVSTKDEISSCTFYDVKPLVVSSKSVETKGERLSVVKEEQDEIIELEGWSSLSSSLSSEIDCSDKELGREEGRGRERNSGYLVLCMIVLFGLIGGKVLAIVLALSWCLMQKMSRWRNVKFPVS